MKKDIKESASYWTQRINGDSIPICHPDRIPLEIYRHILDEGIKDWVSGKDPEAVNFASLKESIEKKSVYLAVAYSGPGQPILQGFRRRVQLTDPVKRPNSP